jgi:hypothetical protein
LALKLVARPRGSPSVVCESHATPSASCDRPTPRTARSSRLISGWSRTSALPATCASRSFDPPTLGVLISTRRHTLPKNGAARVQRPHCASPRALFAIRPAPLNQRRDGEETCRRCSFRLAPQPRARVGWLSLWTIRSSTAPVRCTTALSHDARGIARHAPASLSPWTIRSSAARRPQLATPLSQ